MRLFRPYIPVEIRCRVALRQLGEMWPDEMIKSWKPKPGDAYLRGLGIPISRLGLAALLDDRLRQLADLLGCKVKELRLDHDPALATRMKTGQGKHTVYYPEANDPEHLIYRTAHGHHLKTNVRGDGAQYPDRVLIKRERNRNKPKSRPKTKWGSRPLRSVSRWPKRGSRKIG
jgi:hypothetical protein